MGRCAGAFAEYAVMDVREAIAIPPGLSMEAAAAVPLTFLVVHDMLVLQGRLKPAEWLLVTGVSSGVGVASLQAAKAPSTVSKWARQPRCTMNSSARRSQPRPERRTWARRRGEAGTARSS